MGGVPKRGLMITGAMVAPLVALAILFPIFTTEQTKDVARIGNLKLRAKDETSHVLPPFVGPVALAIGLILIEAGLVARR